jgi:TPR repeat protein
MFPRKLFVFLFITVTLLFIAITLFSNIIFGQLTYDRLSESQIKSLRTKADSGDSIAQSELGQRLYYGIGVVVDESEAAEYLEKASKQGDIVAKAICFDEGLGVERDLEQAAKLYRQAAEKGNSVAQNNLGVCYDRGYGVEKNEREALRWFRKAADQNFATANANMADFYFDGNGVPKDAAKGIALLRKGSEQGSGYAQAKLGMCYLIGKGMEANLSDAHPDDVYNYILSGYHLIGKRIEANPNEAIKLFRKAEEKNHVEVQVFFAIAYGLGLGVEQDFAQAEKRMSRGLKRMRYGVKNIEDAINLVQIEVQLSFMFENGVERFFSKINLSKCPTEFKSAFLDATQCFLELKILILELSALGKKLEEWEKIIMTFKENQELSTDEQLAVFLRETDPHKVARVLIEMNEFKKVMEKFKKITHGLEEAIKQCKKIAALHDVEDFTCFDPLWNELVPILERWK